MSDVDVNKKLQESREMADKLRSLLRQYIEHSKDPDATLALPNLEYMYQIADNLCKNLN